MSIKNLPAFKRPREKIIEQGPHALNDTELLMILLRSGTSGHDVTHLAKSILPSGNISDIHHYSYKELLAKKGLGASGCATILAAREITMRLRMTSQQPSIENVDDLVQIVSHIRNKKKEYFIGIYLNARRQLIQTVTISIGSLNASIVHPREVFEPAIRLGAVDLALAHNHPSGDPQPSHPDILLTQRIARAGDVLGIALIDHIIVCERNYISLQEQNLFKI